MGTAAMWEVLSYMELEEKLYICPVNMGHDPANCWLW